MTDVDAYQTRGNEMVGDVILLNDMYRYEKYYIPMCDGNTYVYYTYIETLAKVNAQLNASC